MLEGMLFNMPTLCHSMLSHGPVRRFHVDMKEFPVIEGIDAKCATLPEFQAAHPSNQPDCPPDQK